LVLWASAIETIGRSMPPIGGRSIA